MISASRKCLRVAALFLATAHCLATLATEGPDKPVRFILPLPDGKTLVGGDFITWDGIERTRLARLNSDDSLDRSFVPELELTNSVQCGAIDSEGRIYVGGSMGEVKGLTLRGIARLSPIGALDRAFEVHLGFNPFVRSIAPLPDGSVLVAGSLDASSPDLRSGSAIINSPRSFFTPPDVSNQFRSTARRALVRYDGRVLLAGAGTNVSDRVARFSADGVLDTSFFSGEGIGSTSIADMVLQSDGRILIAGSFTSVYGEDRRYVARLNPDGTLDDSFAPGVGPNRPISAIASCLDGKVLIGGRFLDVAGVARPRIARLKASGAVDEEFDPGSGLDGEVFSIAIAPNGDALLGGAFRNYNGIEAPYFVRLRGLADPGRSAVAFAAGVIVADESRTNLTISIVRSGSADGAVTMDLVVEAGTARPGVDFESHTRSIQFNQGDRFQEFSVPLSAENSDPADDRTILIRMTNVIGADVVLDRNHATATIQDNDGGLMATYFAGQAFRPQWFGTPLFSRVEKAVAFQWGDGAPGENAPMDFAVIWRGHIMPEYSEEYTFHTWSDDQDRLSVAGKWIIDDWKQEYTPIERKGSIFLEAGRWYPIEIHFDDWGGGPAAIFVSWSSARQPKQIIPRSRLSPRAADLKPSSLLVMPWDRSSGIRLTLLGEPGVLYRLDASTNLANWVPWRLVPVTSALTMFEDPRITNQNVRFYRATVP